MDCLRSEWPGWSKCSADCEAGAHSRTHSLLVEPKNRGLVCYIVENTEARNTWPCDCDSTLDSRNVYTPCSMDCGGGLQPATKHVLTPTRGSVKCLTGDSTEHFHEGKCSSPLSSMWSAASPTLCAAVSVEEQP